MKRRRKKNKKEKKEEIRHKGESILEQTNETNLIQTSESVKQKKTTKERESEPINLGRARRQAVASRNEYKAAGLR